MTIQSKNNNMISSEHSSNYNGSSDEDLYEIPSPIDVKKILANESFPDAVPVMARQSNYID